MDNIYIDKGVCTALTVDLTEFDFTGVEKVILTIKNKCEVKAPVVIEREFTEAKEYNLTITAEESLKICNIAYYDFDEVLTNGMRYKASEGVGKVILREAVGGCIE